VGHRRRDRRCGDPIRALLLASMEYDIDNEHHNDNATGAWRSAKQQQQFHFKHSAPLGTARTLRGVGWCYAPLTPACRDHRATNSISAAFSVKELTETFTRGRSALESQWNRQEQPDTEALLALQRYRSFFNRLLGSSEVGGVSGERSAEPLAREESDGARGGIRRRTRRR
jgi:hypothetical protein